MQALPTWKPLLSVFLAAGFIGTAAVEASAEHATRRAHRVRGQLVVRAKAGAPPRAVERALAKAGVRSRRRMLGLRGEVVNMAPREMARVERELRLSGLFKSVERDYLAGVSAIPNDPLFASQWGLTRSGVPAAWDESVGSAGAPVAVLDTGVDLTHPDLVGNLLPGTDILNGDSDPTDDHGHGTRMAGIVAATWNNSAGIAGVAPGSPILPVKVLGDDGLGPYSAIAQGITWAAAQGAKVINLSLSGGSPSQALQDAVNGAIASGAVCVASAGNDGSATPVYPAATSGVVAVGALDEFDNHPWFSNTGAWLSHSAPGVSVVTTDIGGGYAPSTGTSPAAAFSSGIFSLLFAFEPTLSPATAVARVEQGAFDLGAEGWDDTFGWGGVDALASLIPGAPGAPQPDMDKPSVELLAPTKGALVSGNFGVEVAANDDIGVTRVELFLDNRKYASETNPPYSFVIDAATLSPGKHKLRAYAFDAAGKRSNTRNVKILSTPGVGLLIKKAKVVGDKIRLTASFALPEGLAYDPTVDTVTVEVEANGETVLSAVAEPADMKVSGSGSKAKAIVSSAVPNEGKVQVKTSSSSKGPPIYKLKVKASDLDPMAPIDDVAVVTITVGETVLSQPLSFRSKGVARLVYP